MPVYSDVQVFATSGDQFQQASLIVKTNGGSVLLERSHGAGWVSIDTVATDGATIWEIGRLGGEWRLTPSGGATYEWIVL
jgi:hypothetical protein